MLKSKMKSLMCAILVILTMTVAFAGCEQKPAESSQPEQNVKDMGGYEFRIAAWWDAAPKPGTPIGDAQIERQKEVEENYNCKITYINMPNQEITEKLVSTVLSGDPFADIVWLESNQAIPSLVKGGYIMETDSLFDFNDPKWPKLGLRSTLYNGKHYGFVADVMSTHGIWYNKTFFQKHALPDLYELQQKDEWTWDKYFEIAKKATTDPDQDGIKDTYGLAEGYPIIDRLIASNGGQLIKEEANGKYIFNIEDPLVKEAINFGMQIYKNDLIANFDGVKNVAAFMTGKVAMYGGDAYFGEQFMLEMADDLGFVFYPKGPKYKEWSCTTTNTNIMTLPVGSKRPEDTALIFEALTMWDKIESRNNEFFELNMYNKEDIETAKKMLDICTIDKWPAFPGLSELFWEDIISQVRGDVITLEKAIAEKKPKAQALIDAVL